MKDSSPDSVSTAVTDSLPSEAAQAADESVSTSSAAKNVNSESHSIGHTAGDPALHELKKKTAHGALLSICGQAANFVLRTGSMIILARLLTPADFGLIGMATAFTGFVALFQDAGLSMATIQRASTTRAQTSTLFWINLAVGTILAALCGAVSPAIAAFYHEPRLLWVMVVIGAGFVFSGAGAQHRALLLRQMRFPILTVIDILSLLSGIVLGVSLAATGQGYWALVATTVFPVLVSTTGAWIAGGWIPGPPRRGAGVRSMLTYGGGVTLNNIIVYIAYNADKVLIGRFLGAETLGIYGRAYQLINLPTANLSNAIGTVAIPALSRLQNEPVRLRNYFLRGYGLFLSLVMPITAACALFSEDIVRLFLGAKWDATAPVFRLLAPTILTFSVINPVGWLMLASGQVGRGLKIAGMIAPVVILGYAAGLGYGPNGVAAGFSISTVLLLVPAMLWATHRAPVSALDMLKVAMRPLLSTLIGSGVALASWALIRNLDTALIRLIVANTILFGVYAIVLLFVMDQKDIYLRLLRDIGIWPFAGQRNRPDSKVSRLHEPQVNEQ
jgi:O-antigen/teichoic acid export membrane protein